MSELVGVPGEQGPARITIILHSGSYDRVTNALSLAIIGLTMGMEAHILLTYEALRRFVKGHLEDADSTDAGMLAMLQKGIAAGKLTSIQDKLTTARELGLKLYACTTAMTTVGVTREELVDEVDEIMGLAAFINLANSASFNWYI